MDLDLIGNLTRILNGSATLHSIDYVNGELRISLVKGESTTSVSASSVGKVTAPPPLSEQPLPHGEPAVHQVTAGLIGTFYRSPAPSDPPFVCVGDIVREGQTLAIVEAMKTLNAIDSPYPGRIVEILIPDGTSISMDTVLFHIEPIKSVNV